MKSKIYYLSLFFVALVCANNLFAQSADVQKVVSDGYKAYERGIKAYNSGNYTQCLPDLQKAAECGIASAFDPLISLYADGDYDRSGKGNYQEALSYFHLAQEVYVRGDYLNKDLALLIMRNYIPLNFLTGNYLEVISDVDNRSFLPAYEMLQVSSSYLVLGNYSKATEWIGKALESARITHDEVSIHTANALLSKIELDKKNYSQAIDLSAEAASKGKVPLAAYVLGASLIQTNDRVELGKRWVKLAAEYDYNGIYEINSFEDEIKRYWNSIK